MPTAREFTGLGCAAALMLSTTVWADSAGTNADEEESLDRIRVPAPPVIQANQTDRFGFDSTLVTAAQIEDLNAMDLAAALRRTPGVAISRYNPIGAFGGAEGGGIFIRGRGQSRPGADIQTYIDGIPAYMGVFNHPLLDILPVNAVDQITVYKSPQPHIFGNAMAAVDLRTRRARGEALEGTVRAAIGRYNTRVFDATVSAPLGAVEILAAGADMRSDGHREKAEGELRNGLARLTWQVSPNWSIDGLVLTADNSALDPGPVGQPELRAGQFDTRLRLAGLTLANDFERGAGSLLAYATEGRAYWFRQVGGNDTLTDWSGEGLRFNQTWRVIDPLEVLIGLDIEQITGETQFISPSGPTGFFDGPRFRTTSPFVALNSELAYGDWRFVPSIGVRFYQHNEFSSETAPHAAIIAENGPWQLRANASRGVNYPGLDVVVFSQNIIPPLGESWRDLGAERLDHYEIGIRFSQSQRLTADLAVFRDRGDNRYVFVPPPPPPPFYTNIGGITVEGAEATFSVQANPQWSVFWGVTVLRPSLDSLPYTPRQSYALGVNGVVNRWRISIDAQRVGEQFVLSQGRSAAAVNNQKVDGFLVLNARIGYALPIERPNLELYAAVENLGRTNYEFRPGFPMPKQMAMMGVVGRW